MGEQVCEVEQVMHSVRMTHACESVKPCLEAASLRTMTESHSAVCSFKNAGTSMQDKFGAAMRATGPDAATGQQLLVR